MMLLALVAAVSGSACLNKIPPQRLASRAPIAVAVVLEDSDGAPEGFKKRLFDVLDSRNLEAREVPATALGGQRLSAERFTALKAAGGDAPFALLVETRAEFFAQVTGRYRWTVSVKFTAARAGSTTTSQDQTDFPALLMFEHDKGEEALEDVGEYVASRLTPLIDGLLVGAGGVADAGVAKAAGDAIYFIMVDRFANADPRNDGSDVNPADPNAFHGGDFEGIRAHLDWLSSLGVGTVWLSPVFAMRTSPFNGYAAFHGYWVERLDELEPRFGSEGQLRALRNELDARGIGLMLDVVLNHVGPSTELTRTHPEWFHGRGSIKDWKNPEQLVMNDVQGLPDLADEREDVYAYLRDASLKWIRMVHPAGFRLDAVKHMPSAFWAKFNAEMRRAAGPRFRLLGEMLDGDPAELARVWRDGGFTAMFDFPLRFAMIDVFCKGAPVSHLGALLTEDRRYPDPSQLVTLLDNHDLPRLATECGDASARAVQFMYAMRGVPSLSWGTEVGLTGEKEPANRASMKFDEGAQMKAVISRAAELRRSHPSLTAGVPVISAASETALRVERVSDSELATIDVDATSVRVAFVAGDFRARTEAARKQWLTGERKRRVELTGPADALVVGSGPELGAWKLEHALTLPVSTDLPVGGVFEMKLVSKAKGWEKGPNRVLFVADEAGPMKVELQGRGT